MPANPWDLPDDDLVALLSRSADPEASRCNLRRLAEGRDGAHEAFLILRLLRSIRPE